jgi:hypothetical protein
MPYHRHRRRTIVKSSLLDVDVYVKINKLPAIEPMVSSKGAV